MIYRPEIDGLRAVAVVSVLLFHAGLAFIPGGFMGVDIFFVISGFLITSLIARDIADGTFSMVNFWERRARRILPAFFVVVLAMFAAAFFILLPADFIQLGKETLAQSVFSSNFLFAKQGGYFDTASDLKPLLHTWSLAVEEQFYLFFPIGMYLIGRYLKGSYLPLLILAAVLSFALSLYAINMSQRYAFYLLPFRGWELLVGSIIAIINVRGTKTVRESVCLAGFALIGIGLFAYDDTVAFPGYAALLPVLGAAAIIWSNKEDRTACAKILATPFMVGIGLISYSLYLWHWPVIMLVRYAALPLMEFDLWLGAMCITASFVLAYLTWKYVEQPVRARAVFKTRRTLFIFSLAGLILMAIIGAAIIKTHGLPNRFNSGVLAYAAAVDDTNPHRAECDQPAIERIKKSAVCQTNAAAGKPTFALWGDSFADAIAPAFYDLSEKHGKNGYVLTSRGCKPILNVENPSIIFKYNCIGQTQAFLDLILHEKIRKVFLVASWSGLSGKKGNVDNAIDEARSEELGIYPNAYMSNFARTLDILKQNNVQTIILVNPPGAKLNLPRVLALQEYWNVGQKYTIPKTGYTADLNDSILKFEKFYGDETILYLNPVARFCDRDSCITSLNGQSLYADEAHLSNAGARFLMPILDKVF